jgi:hypothetical protein
MELLAFFIILGFCAFFAGGIIMIVEGISLAALLVAIGGWLVIQYSIFGCFLDDIKKPHIFLMMIFPFVPILTLPAWIGYWVYKSMVSMTNKIDKRWREIAYGGEE